MQSTKHTYVYKLTDKSTGKFYFGYRTCLSTRDPLDDLGHYYFSSGKFKKTFKEFPSCFDKEILFTSSSKFDAYQYEQLIIQSNIHDKYCVNMHYDKDAINNPSKVKSKKEFNQVHVNKSRSKRAKSNRKDRKLTAKRNAYEKQKRNYVQYCDLETRAIVYIIP